jgi:RNA polymerase sigma factor (sigma-70 family)
MERHHEMEDSDLLAEYARTGSEAAFRTLVERHLNLVHGSALRQLSEPHLAEEVTQAVFILLARKAQTLGRKTVLVGWLFRTTRFVASHARRTEHRRRRREQEAFEMQNMASTKGEWERIAPVLDEALEKLGKHERNAVLLRFVEGHNHREVGAALGLTEEAARKRVDRALEKLRGFFAGRGFTISATALGALLLAGAAKAAPAGLLNVIASGAITGGKAAASTLPPIVAQTIEAWRWAKVKLVATSTLVGAIALVITMILLPSRSSVRAAAGSKEVAVAPVTRPAIAVQAQVRPSLPRAGSPAGEVIRFHVLARDSDEPVAGAKLLVTALPASFSSSFVQFEVLTDAAGTSDVLLPRGARRADIGVLASGWGARFVTWSRDKDGGFPPEYTLHVQRLTNSVGGWVRDESGRPVPGAQVWIQFGGTSDYAGVETPRERPGVFDSALVAVSDRQGRWDCKVIPTQNRGFSLEAQHPDYSTASIAATWSRGPGQDADKAILEQLQAGTLVTTMKRGLDLYGRVTDSAGRAVAGARFAYQPAPHSAPEVTSDLDGRVAFHGLGEGLLAFTVTAEGCAPEYRTVQIHTENEPLEVKLQPGALLRLKVVDRQGAAVPGATVVFDRLEENSVLIYGYDVKWQSLTSDDGRVEWRSAPTNKNLLICTWKDGWCQSNDVPFKADGLEHTIILDRGLQVTGRVTDEVTGLPVPDFKAIPIYGRDPGAGLDRLETVRGADGAFKLAFNEARTPWRARIEADGYLPVTSDTLSPAFTGELEVKLKRARTNGPSIRGKIVNPDGAPVLGAQVALLALDNYVMYMNGMLMGRNDGRVVFTDDDGSFSFAPNSSAHSVAATGASGYAKLRVSNPDEPIVLRLQPWGRIEGDVADSLLTKPGTSLQLVDGTAMNYQGAVRIVIDARPDASGQFKFEKVPPGRYIVSLNRGQGQVRPVSQTEVIVRSSQTSVAHLAASGVTISGKLEGGPGLRMGADRQQLGAIVLVRPQSAPTPAGISGDAAALWAVDYWQSDAGRDYYWRTRYFPAQVATNKSFVAEGVERGTYSLQAWIGKANSNNQVQITKIDVIQVQVPEPAKGELDLGTLNLPASK